MEISRELPLTGKPDASCPAAIVRDGFIAMPLDLFGRVSTADTGARSEFDFYETPRWMTMALLRHHPSIAGKRVIKPCSGRNAIADVLHEFRCSVVTVDIDPRQPAMFHGDATQPDTWLRAMSLNRPEWVVTNVAFNVAFGVLSLAHEHATEGVAMILRKTFTEPTEDRGAWLRAHPPTRTICLPRYSFHGKGNDSTSCDWFIWEKQPNRSLPAFVVDDLAEKHR